MKKGFMKRLRFGGFALANRPAPSTPSVDLLFSTTTQAEFFGREDAHVSKLGGANKNSFWNFCCEAQKFVSGNIPRGCRNKKNFAFTLAEVLITLAIIGVVAALTIPTVVQNYRKTQATTQLKKAYSALANTTNLAIANEGPVSGWKIEDGQTGSASIDFANTYLIPYLKVQKNCETQTTGDCEFKWMLLDKSSSGSFSSSYARFYLTDGTFLAVATSGSSTDKRAGVHIDLNGQKGPNTYGKDIFYYNYFILHEDSSVTGKFMPAWYNADRNFLKTKCTTQTGGTDDGKGCTALIMRDSWQMKDDYPW